MKNSVVTALAFVAGAAAGSLVTWQLVKKKYEQYAQEEIDSVKEFFSNKNEAKTEDATEEGPEAGVIYEPKLKSIREQNAEVYGKQLQILGYLQEDEDMDDDEEEIEEEPSKPLKAMKMNSKKKPYVIPPEDYGEIENYDKVTLMYYEDGVLAYDDDRQMSEDEINDCVGIDSLKSFGEFEDDSVHVRNEQYAIDYEILAIKEKYADVIKTRPYLVED